MIPISCSNMSSSQQQVFPANMPLGLMMQGTPAGFIPLCMGEPVLGSGFMYNIGAGDQEKEAAARGQLPTSSRQAAAPPQFELPNCLAVNSCMTHRENTKEQDSGKKPVKRDGVRPSSNGGSHHTSVKGEPGSALESNASAGASVKGRNQNDQRNVSTRSQNKQIGEELCSSSQSLYSFLPSSDENDITDFLQASSSKPDDSDPEEKVKNVRHVARPVLSEPFWNENVHLSHSLMKQYQLEQTEPESVLKRDLEKLRNMTQSQIVEDQLKVN